MQVKIGSFEIEYTLCKTNAPSRYDGFGTLTVYSGDEARYVLVDVKHLDWQLGRYGSGMYTHEMCNDIPENEINRLLVESFIKNLDRSND